MLFAWQRVTGGTVGAAVHTLPLKSQALQKKPKTKLGGNLGNKTWECVCVVPTPKSICYICDWLTLPFKKILL